MIRGKTTDTLENTIKTYCKDDEHAEFLCSVLDDTLQRYQWHYQTSEKIKEYRNVRNRYTVHIETTIQLLHDVGQHTLADNVKDALYNDKETSVYTQNKVFSQAKKHMKNKFLSVNMPSSTYEKGLAYSMGYLFEEWCETFPLEESPAHFNDDFYP